MKRFVLTYNEVVGFHRYPNASQFCSYLADKHRHVFVVQCEYEVSHNERQIEINQQQIELNAMLENTFGSPCDFKGMSCESIAEWIVKNDNTGLIHAVTVKEDDYGGAKITK